MGRPNQTRRFILTAILIVIVLILLIFVIYQDQDKTQNNGVLNNGTEYHENIFNTNSGETETEPEISGTAEEIHTDEIQTEPAEPNPEEIIPPTTNPPVKVKRIYQDKFDSLRAKYNNDDIIGIIKIPDTVVYYPVAHSTLNNEYYLDRNLYKNLSAAGSICMDYENSIERHDPNTILYGHQMYSNSMFHTLRYYMDEDFFNGHRYIIFNTIYEDNVWEVFAFFKTHISFNYIKVFFRSERNFLSLAAEMKERSIYDTGIEIKEGDRILTLSSCTNEDPDTRYVLSARMIKNKSDIPEDIAAQMAGAVGDFK